MSKIIKFPNMVSDEDDYIRGAVATMKIYHYASKTTSEKGFAFELSAEPMGTDSIGTADDLPMILEMASEALEILAKEKRERVQ